MAKVEKATLKQALQERKSELKLPEKVIWERSGVGEATIVDFFRPGCDRDIRFKTLHKLLSALDLKIYVVGKDGTFIKEIIKNKED